jgi:hypothetical protein
MIGPEPQICRGESAFGIPTEAKRQNSLLLFVCADFVGRGLFADDQRAAINQGAGGVFVDDARDEGLIGHPLLGGGRLNIKEIFG